MFVVGELIRSLGVLFDMVFGILYFLLVVRIVLSFFAVSPHNEVFQIVYKITEPILAPFRFLPLRVGALDFSPIVAFLLLRFLNAFIVGLLNRAALRFG